MSTQQQQPRPWFRMVRPAAPAPAPAPPPAARPAAPTPAPQPPRTISPFRPPVSLAPPPPPPAPAPPAPSSPVAPQARRSPVLSASSVTPTAPRSPTISSTGASPPPAAGPAPNSPAAINRNAVAAPASPPPAAVASIARSPVDVPKAPPSPIVKNSSSSTPASPHQKASAEASTPTRPSVFSASLPPSLKTEVVASAPSSSPTLRDSPASKTLLDSQAPTNAAAGSVPQPRSPAVATVKYSSQISSPKTVKPSREKTPSPPQQLKTLSHPPSPFTLPPRQLKVGTHGAAAHNHDLEPIPPEAEQKTVLMHEKPSKIMNLQKSSGERERQQDKINTSTKNSVANSPEFGLRVVTLAGENKGAIMELSAAASGKKYGSGQHFWGNGQKLGSDEDDEGRYNNKDENERCKTKAQLPMDDFVNSNVQGINNSILFNCTYKNRDLGVHLSVSRKGNGVHGA